MKTAFRQIAEHARTASCAFCWPLGLLVCIGFVAQAARAQDGGPGAVVQLPGEKKSNDLLLRKSSLADTVVAISEKFKLNIVTDVYSREQGYRPDWNIEGETTGELLSQVADVHRRAVRRVGNVVVLRHLRSAYEAKQERTPGYRKLWADLGSVILSRLDGTVLPLHGRTSSVTTTPVDRVCLVARNVSIDDLVSRLKKDAGWQISVDPDLGSHRISAYMQDLTETQFIGALEVLLNAKQGGQVQQTAPQRALDTQTTAIFIGNQDQRHTLSDTLKPRLVELFTPAQMESLRRGEIVNMSIESLPPGLQSELAEYVRVVWTAIEKAGPPVSVRPAEFLKFSIEFWPMPSNPLTIRALTTEGKAVAF